MKWFHANRLPRNRTDKYKAVVMALEKIIDVLELAIRSGLDCPSDKQFIRELTWYIIKHSVDVNEGRILEAVQPVDSYKLLNMVYEKIVELFLLMSRFNVPRLKMNIRQEVEATAKIYLDRLLNGENIGTIGGGFGDI